jgi:hypothetical protein
MPLVVLVADVANAPITIKVDDTSAVCCWRNPVQQLNHQLTLP